MWAVFLYFATSILLPGTLSEVERAVSMTISPTYASRTPGWNVTVMCKSDLPLVGCNFRVRLTDTDGNVKLNQDYPVMDFSRGSASDKTVLKKHADLYEAEYSGRGLAGKECGILFTPSSRGRYLVGCRGRAATGGWSYGFMSLYVQDGVKPTYQIDPRDIKTEANKNGDAVINHKVKGNHSVLRSCTFILPRKQGTVQVDSEKYRSKIHGKYEAQRNDAYCSISLKQLTEQDNGLLWYWAATDAGSDLYFKSIIILKAPTVALQPADHDGPYAPGDVLTATCTASDSRPVAAISWLLGGVTIRNDPTDDAAGAKKAWRWPWDVETVTQTVTRKLSAADNGKVLTCRVEHPALKRKLEKNITIRVNGGETSATAVNPDTRGTKSTTHDQEDNLADPTQLGRTIPEIDTNYKTKFNPNPARTDPGPIPSPPQLGATFPGPDSDPPDSTTVVAIVATCVVVPLSIVAALVYAKVARRCCFRSAEGVSDAPVTKDRRGREKPVERPVNTIGKPRAPSPGKTGASMKSTRLSDEEAVVYADIAGAKTSGGSAKKHTPEDTTYAELTFQ